MPDQRPADADLDAEQCPDLAEADALGDALFAIFGLVRVCRACRRSIISDDPARACVCGRRPDPPV
jgi:hypothetical protein